MTGQDFERSIVHAFNDYSSNFGFNLIAYRHLQFRYQPQLFDVLVDCGDRELYLALEMKSIDVNSYNCLYFTSHFSWTKGVCQVARESAWLDLSGRKGFLVVEARRGKARRSTVFFVPWGVVRAAFQNSDSGIRYEEIICCPGIDKQGGKYIFDEQFIDDLVSYSTTEPHAVTDEDCTRRWK